MDATGTTSAQDPPPCPTCSQKNSKQIGQLVNVGGILKLPEEGMLYDCPDCHLLFRHPYLTEEEVISQYGALLAEHWPAEPGMRPDFDRASAFLLKHLSSGVVLDIGCFTGEFLAGLPAQYEKYGVEPSGSAAALATERGITIVGKSLEETSQSGFQADAIIAIDLIEHLRNPLDLILFAQKTLRPGGFLIVSTGNPDYWLWSRHRLDYWYNFTEHIAFLRKSWFEWSANRTELHFHTREEFCHYKMKPAQTAHLAALSAAYELTRLPGVAGKIFGSIPPFSRARTWTKPPSSGWMPDHHMVVLQKP